MSKLMTTSLTILVALVCASGALGYTPQPHQFALQTSIAPFQACVVPGQNFTFSVTVTNAGKATATAKVSTDPMGSSSYQFDYVSSRPLANSAVTTYYDPAGNGYSYTIYSWQQRLKPGKSATFSVTAQAPDWNTPIPPYTDPDTGQTFTTPPPQPYPTSFGFFTEVVGDAGAGQNTSLRLAYCGQQVPDLGQGFGK